MALQGGKSGCLRRVEPERILDLIMVEKVSHHRGAPIAHGFIGDETQKRGLIFDPPIEALIGGAPPPVSLLAEMAGIVVHLTRIYGLTETCGPTCIWERQPRWADLDSAT